MIKLVRDHGAMNVLAKFEKWSVKIYRRESVNGDFPCAKLENAKKNRQIFFWRLWQNPELILINMFRPTYVPNLVTLAWTRPTLDADEPSVSLDP